jgi:hypothetical protein
MKFPNLRSLIALFDGATFWRCRDANVIAPRGDVVRSRRLAPMPGDPARDDNREYRDFATQVSAKACDEYALAN